MPFARNAEEQPIDNNCNLEVPKLPDWQYSDVGWYSWRTAVNPVVLLLLQALLICSFLRSIHASLLHGEYAIATEIIKWGRNVYPDSNIKTAANFLKASHAPEYIPKRITAKPKVIPVVLRMIT
eukprot:4133173-Amphidinium_carterae.1